jgi:septum formation protein
MKKLILASTSPRRKALFSLFEIPFNVIPANIDEGRRLGESPPDYVSRLAREKAHKVGDATKGLVLAADTIVVDGDELLGKPVDEAEAMRMLQQLRSRTHQVYTGIVLLEPESGKIYEDICRTEVPMRDYSDAEIDAYIATGDPMDKAGAYAIQHAGLHPVDGLEGCFASVMGLPICHLVPGLRRFGFEVPEDLPQRCEELLNYRCPKLAKVVDLS